MSPPNQSTRDDDGSLNFEQVEYNIRIEGGKPDLSDKLTAIEKAIQTTPFVNASTDVSQGEDGYLTFYTENLLVKQSDRIDLNHMNNEAVAESIREQITALVRAIEPRSKVTAKFMEDKPKDWDFIVGDDEFDDDFSEDGLV